MPFGIKDYHKTLEFLHVGCEAPRAYFIPYAKEESASAALRDYSEFFKTLTGAWDFRFYESVTELPKSISEVVFEEKMDVPANWQHTPHRSYDAIQYTNIEYPFPLDPPHVPTLNPCAVYSREFSLCKSDIENKDVMLNFEGVDSCFYLFVNGKFVGYSQVSHMTSEFNVTSFVTEGNNEISLLVIKWCDGSYLEDQDMFRSSGIFREPYLLFRDKERINDVFVKYDISEDFLTATVSAELKTSASIKVDATLTDKEGSVVGAASANIDKDGKITFPTLENPKLWSDECPYLYTLTLKAGTEIIKIKVGIRKIEIKGNVILINGKKVKAKGVNRHDSHPILGHATPMEHMRRDIEIMKRHNVNFIRTSHYPNDPRFYELCDEYGLYMCDEADIECHGSDDWVDNILTDSPEWTESYMDRTVRMVERDKNHPAVVMWSVGNESGAGINHKLAFEYFKSKDPSRLAHVEDESRIAHIAELRAAGLKPASYKRIKLKHSAEHYRSYTEFESRMYPEDELLDYYVGKDKKLPFFMCEYSHAMGNSPGDLKHYWDLIYKNDNFFGGCVWEFTDHAAVKGDFPYQSPQYIYGGDSGEYPHFGEFCVDGLVYPDRRVHTGLIELKEVLKPFICEYKNGTLTVISRRCFESLSDLSLYVTIEKNGKIYKEYDFGALKIKPASKKSYKIEVPNTCGYLTLNVSVRQNTSTAWAPFGYEVGSQQFILSDSIEEKSAKLSATLTKTDKYYEVRFGETLAKIGLYTGLIESFVSNGKEALASPVKPTIWRAPTDNDRKIRKQWELNYFDKAATNLREISAEEKDGIVKVFADVTLGACGYAPIAYTNITYTFGESDGVRIDCTATRGKASAFGDIMPALPRFGFEFRLPEDYEDVRYFGYGPYESYVDKRIASRVSLYKTTASENFEHYVRPQENSSHYGCKWAEVTSVMGQGIYVSAEDFSLSVSHYSPVYLTSFSHDFELVPEKETTLIVDYKNAGIGSHSCGPILANEYTINEKEFSFSFNFKPTSTGRVDPFVEYVK